MRVLCHLPLSAFCRKIRLALAEKRLPFEAVVEHPWDQRPEFLALNPSGDVPVLIEHENLAVCGHAAITEYLEEAYPQTTLLGHSLEDRAEVRRLISWFDDKFYREVTVPVVGEKIMRRLQRDGAPDAVLIRAGLSLLHTHLKYISSLAEQRSWLAGPSLTLADFAAGAHLSVLDYLGDVPWDRHPEASAWYMRLKSRPCFRALLTDAIPGMPPAAHYADLDF